MSTETQLSKGAFDTSAYNALLESTAAGVREGLRAQVETKRNEIFDQLRARVKEAAKGLKDEKLDKMIDHMKDTNWKEVAKEVGLAATSAMVPKLLAQWGTATGLAVTAAEAEAVAAGTELVPLLGAAEAGEVAAVGAEAAAGAGAVGVLEGLSLSNPWTAVVFGLAAGSYFLFKDRKKGPGGPAHHLKQGDWVIINDGFKTRNKFGGMGGEMEYERVRMHSPGFFIEPTPGKDSLRQDVYNFNSGRVESKGFRDLMLMPPTEVEAVVKTKVLPLVRDLWFADELVQKQVCETGTPADPGSVVRVHGRNLAVVESSGGMLLLEDAVGSRELVPHGSAERFDAKHNAVWNYDLKDHQKAEPFDSAGNDVMYAGQFIWTKPGKHAVAVRPDTRAELACIASFEARGMIRAYSCLDSRLFAVPEKEVLPVHAELQAVLSRAARFHNWQAQVVDDSVDRQISPGRYKTLECLGIAPGADNQHALVERPPWEAPRMTREEAMAQKGAMCDAIAAAAEARDAGSVGGEHQDALAISAAEEQARLAGVDPRTVRHAAENYDGSLDDVFAAEEAAYRVAPAPALSSTMNMVLGIAAVGVVLLATGAVEAL